MMPDLKNFSVYQQGQQIMVKGDVVDSTTGAKLADFGPNGTNFVTWLQQLPVAKQLYLVETNCTPAMIGWLLGTWPDIPMRTG